MTGFNSSLLQQLVAMPSSVQQFGDKIYKRLIFYIVLLKTARNVQLFVVEL